MFQALISAFFAAAIVLLLIGGGMIAVSTWQDYMRKPIPYCPPNPAECG